MTLFFRSPLLTLVSLLFTTAFVLSKDTGSLVGTIVDDSGRPVSNVEVVVLELQRGTTTDDSGQFRIGNLPGGRFTLEVHHVSFESLLLTDIILPPNRPLQLPKIQLETRVEVLGDVVVTATRRQKSLADISNAVNAVGADKIAYRNAKTSAEALREETGVFVQKTNHGGGSAIIRGLSSNQILILVDGIRLNNSTYRLGNHQYLTTVDQNMIDQLEVVRGPTSVLYGSDALGGTINLVTSRPALADQQAGWDYNLGLTGQAASADSEISGRMEGALFNNRFALTGGYSYKDFGDLKRGTNGDNPALENSTDGLYQRPTAFSGYDADLKLISKISTGQNLILAYQESSQEDVPRYDKYESGDNVLWLYTPQSRRLGYLKYDADFQKPWIRNLQMTLSRHFQEEGRRTQKRIDSPIESELDQTTTWGATFQATATGGNHILNYGSDFYFDDVASRRLDSDERGRYPDGAVYRSSGLYLQDEWLAASRLTITSGFRFSYFSTQFELPEDSSALNPGKIDQQFQALTGSLGAIFRLSENVNLAANLAQAFRAPNLSDLSKLGESKGSTYEVPNADLVPEKMLSGDLGIRIAGERGNISLVGYYARINDLLASVDASYNNSGTILYGADTLKIKQKANTGRAYFAGFESAVEYQLNERFSAYGNLTWTYGQNTSLDEPIGGVPPLFGAAGLRWRGSRGEGSVYLRFAGAQERLSSDDLDDPRIPTGGTPAWHTVNLRAGLKISSMIYLQAALENMLDLNYREHGSGVNGPGRNFVLRAKISR